MRQPVTHIISHYMSRNIKSKHPHANIAHIVDKIEYFVNIAFIGRSKNMDTSKNQ